MRIRSTLQGLLSVLALAVATPARAQTPAATAPEHGKLATADASPVDAGVLELELSYAPTWTLRGTAPFDRSERGEAHALGLAATYGLVEGVDAGVAVAVATARASAYDRDPDDGIGPRSAHGGGLADVEAQVRWRFLNAAERGLEAAVIGGLVAPTGARASSRHPGLTQEYWSAGGALVVTRDLGPLTGNLEVGASLPFGNGREGARTTVFANLAGGWQARPWLQPELELNYESTAAAHGPRSEVLSLTGGLLAPFGDGYRLAAGLQWAVWGRHTGQELAATVAFKWGY